MKVPFIPVNVEAEQVARANAHSCHAACYGNEDRMEEVDCCSE
jgi:hypothetical protein